MSQTQHNLRNSNLEILRIIAMLFIVSFHIARHGFDGVDFLLTNPNSYVLYFLAILGKIGVDVFVLISAYFMVKNKFTFRKFLILGGEVYFYSIILLAVFVFFLTPMAPITLSQVVKSVLPISHKAYWFITDYIILMILSPFLNMAIERLSRSDYIKLLMLLLVIWSVFPVFTGKSFDVTEMVFFFVLYLIGGFIRLHVDIDRINVKRVFLIGLVSLGVLYILFAGFGSIDSLNHMATFNKESSVFKQAYSIFVVITSVALFLIFLKRKEFSNRYINYISGSVLGVYLIHSNIFVYPYLLNKVLHVQTYINSPKLVIHLIVWIFLIYFACTGIDILRRLTIEKVWIGIVDTRLCAIPVWFNRKFEEFEKRFSYYLK